MPAASSVMWVFQNDVYQVAALNREFMYMKTLIPASKRSKYFFYKVSEASINKQGIERRNAELSFSYAISYFFL